MSSYYATASFQEKGGFMFRYDTKLWFDKPARKEEGVCVGAVLGLNPGSSAPAEEPGVATVDQTMGCILRAFETAASSLGKTLPKNAFVRMWNLMYLCDSNQGSAIEVWLRHPEFAAGDYLDPTESQAAPFVWFAWTASAPIGLAVRALSRHEPACWLGMDGKPHFGRPDLLAVRHPSRKGIALLASVVEPMLRAVL